MPHLTSSSSKFDASSKFYILAYFGPGVMYIYILVLSECHVTNHILVIEFLAILHYVIAFICSMLEGHVIAFDFTSCI